MRGEAEENVWVSRETRKTIVRKMPAEGENSSVPFVSVVCLVHFLVKIKMCINHSTCVCICVHMCVICWQAEGFWQGRAEHSCWVVMSWELAVRLQTDSPVYVPLQRRNHSVCVSIWVCVFFLVSVWLCYWLTGEAGEAERHSRGSTFPCRSGQGTTYWYLPLMHMHTEIGSFSCFAEHSSCVACLCCSEWLPFASQQSLEGGRILALYNNKA